MSSYVLPSTAGEAERLNYQHHLLLKTFGGLYRAPLDHSPKLVLDIGCGTGAWSKDFALQHPDSVIVGLDLQDSPHWTNAPSNCRFHVGDLHDENMWSELARSEGSGGQNTSFNFIHARLIAVAVRNWPLLLRRCFSLLAPAGWLELQDFCFPVISVAETPHRFRATELRWSRYMIEGMEAFDLSPAAASAWAYLLPSVGFERETMRIEDYRMLLGKWPEAADEHEMGAMGQENFRLGVRGFSETMLEKHFKLDGKEREQFYADFGKALEDGASKAYLPFKLCFARKPV